MRTLSALMKSAANAQDTGEVILPLLTITHASILDGPLRFVRNLTNITSNGNVFTAFPFDITLPDDDEQGQQKMRLRIDNIDRQIVAAIRSIPPSQPPTIQLDIILASQPNTIELSFAGFVLREVDYDALVVEGELRQEEITVEPFVEGSFTPQHFPGLF